MLPQVIVRKLRVHTLKVCVDVLSVAVVSGIAQFPPRSAQAQDTDLSASQAVPIACPESFNTFYVDPVFGRFDGRSGAVSSNAEAYVYFFRGQSSDGVKLITGQHIVYRDQCMDAWLQVVLGIPAQILVLRNKDVRFIGGTSGECSVEDASYDPYYTGGESQTTHGCSTGGGGSGGGSASSGTQYYPGDFTGGETVDWQTGIGNGGRSVCGTAAEVQPICIEIYNETTRQWEEWACGYATVC